MQYLFYKLKTKMIKLNAKIVKISLLAAVAVIGFKIFSKGDVTISPIKKDLVVAIYGNGLVKAKNSTTIVSEVNSKITEILSHEGQEVKKGDILAKLDNSYEEAILNSMIAQRDFLQSELQRSRALHDKKFVSNSYFENLESQLKNINSKIIAEEKLLDKYNIRAPFDGIVVKQDLDIGEFVNPEKPLIYIADDKIRIEAEIDEEDILDIKNRQKVIIKPNSLSSDFPEGIVESITPQGDEVNRNFRIFVSVPNDNNPSLKIGMTVDVNVVKEIKQDAMFIPVDAVKNNQVKLKKWSGETMQDIETGITNGNMIEVISGLTMDDKIIIK